MPKTKSDDQATENADKSSTEPQKIARAQIEWLRILARSVVQLFSK